MIKNSNKKTDPKKHITVKMIQRPDTISLRVTPECKKAYQEFIKANGWGYAHTTAALTSYMEAYNNNEIKVSIDV